MRMLEPGDVIADKYQVKALLGRGGMGAVYLVRHALTGRRFALKVLAPTLVGTASASQRLVREALAAGRIEHRNVVDVFDVGEHNGAVYLVMEYLEGRPMSELLDAGELSDRAILALLLRAMEGVAAAHDHGIVHRDLKPENIFICFAPDGSFDEPRVMDFGISQLPEQLHGGDTHSGFVVGTPHFMCLEQLEGLRDLDARVDVYALGVSLYRAFAGRVPFEARSLEELSQRIAYDIPAPLGTLRPDLPQLLSQTIMRAMARHRDDRHPSVRVLSRDLESFVLGLSEQPLKDRKARLSATGAMPALNAQVPLASPAVAPQTTVAPAERRRVSPWVYVALSGPLAALTLAGLSELMHGRAVEAAPASAPEAAQQAPATAPQAAQQVPAPARAEAPLAPAPNRQVSAAPLVPEPLEDPPAAARGRFVKGMRNARARKPQRPAPAPAPVAAPQAAPVREVAASAVQARSEPGADLLQEFQQRGPSKTRTLDEQDPYAE
jgi:serine/threonine-protein kinase